MRGGMVFLFAGLAAFAAGCAMFSGTIEDGIPKLRDKLPVTARIYVACPTGANGLSLHTRNARIVATEFSKAFAARGVVAVTPPERTGNIQDALGKAKAENCDKVLFTRILDWEYGDAGFSGVGGRDEVVLSAVLMDVETERILYRARLYVNNGIGRSAAGGGTPEEAVAPVILKYVRSLFPPED